MLSSFSRPFFKRSVDFFVISNGVDSEWVSGSEFGDSADSADAGRFVVEVFRVFRGRFVDLSITSSFDSIRSIMISNVNMPSIGFLPGYQKDMPQVLEIACEEYGIMTSSDVFL